MHNRVHTPETNRSGQSLIESCLAVALICVLLLGLLQVSQLLAAKEILNHASARAARARTVGFDDWMAYKAARVAVIPNAGRLLEPVVPTGNPVLRQLIETGTAGEVWDAGAYDLAPTESKLQMEQARIPEYMGALDAEHARWLLDYEDWDSVRIGLTGLTTDESFTMVVRQDVLLRIPFHRAFYAADQVALKGETEMEHHAGLYLDPAPAAP